MTRFEKNKFKTKRLSRNTFIQIRNPLGYIRHVTQRNRSNFPPILQGIALYREYNYWQIRVFSREGGFAATASRSELTPILPTEVNQEYVPPTFLPELQRRLNELS